jgi:hypothetical protein
MTDWMSRESSLKATGAPPNTTHNKSVTHCQIVFKRVTAEGRKRGKRRSLLEKETEPNVFSVLLPFSITEPL